MNLIYESCLGLEVLPLLQTAGNTSNTFFKAKNDLFFSIIYILMFLYRPPQLFLQKFVLTCTCLGPSAQSVTLISVLRSPGTSLQPHFSSLPLPS